MRERHLVDGFDAVVEEEHLAAAFHLAADGVADDAFVVGADGGGNRHPVRRRGVDGGHVARAHQRHVERARDRRGGECQHIHLAEELFELLLVGDAEALLLIDDDEAEILELHIAGNQAVGADDEVHRAIGDAGDGVADFRGRAEAVEQIDADRIVRHAFAEGAPVLFGENGGGHEDGDLFAAGDGLEGGADGDFGFAEADIAADQAVHRARRFEVEFGFLDGAALVGGLGVVERALELPHPLGVRRVGEAGFVLALGLHAEELGGVVEDGFLGGLARVFPCGAAEFVEVGRFAAEADVFADEVGLFERHAEQRAVAVFEQEFLAIVALLDAAETGDAVFVVHDEIAFLHFIDGGAGAGGAGFFQRAAAGGAGRAVAAEEFGGGEHRELDDRQR